MARDTNDDRQDPGPPPSTPIVLGGLIGKRYEELGGKSWGYPVHTELATPDGVGRYVHFKDHPQRQGTNLSIYWTPDTGAHEIYGYIRNKWESMNWEHSFLGYPTSGELATHDNVGRYQTFQGGIIVWHPDTGAHEVHGSILDRYGALGGSAWGYPTTDEGDARGPGRFHHFVELPGGHNKSIYWSPDTGAHEVIGYIRHQYEAMGWEHSFLGYPVSAEEDWSELGQRGRQQRFQGGRILYRARDNATSPDPVQFNRGIRSKGLESFGADVNLELHFDGSVRLHGRVTTDGEGYDWAINAMVRTSNVGVAIRDSGHIPGKVPEIGKRNQRHFEAKDTKPAINQFFFELKDAELELHEKHDGDLTGVIDNVLATMLSWGAVAAAGPGAVFLIYAGAELGGIIGSGNFTGGLRIVNGTGFMLGPGGFLLAITDLVASIGSKERGLTAAERAMADLVFDGALDDIDIILTDSQIVKGKGFTFPGLSGRRVYLNIGEEWEKNPDLANNAGYRQFLIHELVHAWQFKNMGFLQEYVVDGAFARVQELVAGHHATYDPGPAGKPWDDYRLEQQATLIEEWFAEHYRDADTDDHNLASAAAMNDPRFRYVAGNLRTGSA